MQPITERERLLGYVGQYLPVGMNPADVDLNEFAAQGPALFRLLEMKAQGRLSNSLTVTDKFLRCLDEDLLDNLVALALTFSRRGGIKPAESWGRELYWISGVVARICFLR